MKRDGKGGSFCDNGQSNLTVRQIIALSNMRVETLFILIIDEF